MAPVGTLQSLTGDREICLVRWTMDDFLKLAREVKFLADGLLVSEDFGFGHCTFYVSIDITRDFLDDEDETEAYLRAPLYVSLQRFSWKLSVEGSDGRILQSAEGVEERMHAFPLMLGSISDLKRLLHPDGSLVLRCEIRLGPEVTADAPSLPLQLSGPYALAGDLEKLLASQEATDATVRVQGKRFLVHRAIMIARTPVFAAMFRHQMSETESGVVNIEDCDPDIFRHFLHFVYTGSVENLRPEEAMELYSVADKYQMDELKSRCVRCTCKGLSIESFCPTITLALQHSEKKLTKRASEFFADNADEIVKTTKWQEFLCKNPIEANELFMKALKKKAAILERTASNYEATNIPTDQESPEKCAESGNKSRKSRKNRKNCK